MTPGRRLRIAVIGGAGNMGREHARRIAGCPRSALAGVVDPADSAASRAAQIGTGTAHHFPTVEAMLAAAGGALPQIDGAIVATPNHLHVPVALTLLAAGIPVLVEKPIAESVESAAMLVAKAREAGAPAVLIGHHRRHSAAILAARDIIASGALGRIVGVHASTLLRKPDSYFGEHWRRQPGTGGPILINLVHDIDSLRALCGEIIAVQAVASNRTRGLDVEDSAAVLLEFSSGALGTLVLSDAAVSPASWEHTSGENPVYPRETAQDCIFIAGTLGSLAVPTMRVWRQDAGAEASWHQPFVTEHLSLPENVDPLARQLDHFCDIIEHNAAPLVTAADAAQTLAVTLAVKEAAASGRRVRLVAVTA